MRFLRLTVSGAVSCLFASIMVGATPLVAQVTPPEDFLGFKPGADFHLLTYEQAISYFENLAEQSDRMLVLDMGETSDGRRMKYGVISSAPNLERLDHFKEIKRRISLTQGNK